MWANDSRETAPADLSMQGAETSAMKGRQKLTHLFDERVQALAVKGFKLGLSVEDLGYLLGCQSALIEEMIRKAMVKL